MDSTLICGCDVFMEPGCRISACVSVRQGKGGSKTSPAHRHSITIMKTSIIITLMASLPLFAQEAPAPEGGIPQVDMLVFEGATYDANKDGLLDDQEKQAMKAGIESRLGELATKGKGHGGRGHGMRPQGDMRQKMLDKFDANKDGQLDDQEKQAMKAQFEAKRGERGPKGEGMGPGAHNKRGHWQGPRTKMPRNPKDKPKADQPATLEIPQE